MRDYMNIIQNDLEKLFPQYQVGVEKRKTTCLVLVRTSKKDKLKSNLRKQTYKSTPFGYTLREWDPYRDLLTSEFIPLTAFPLSVSGRNWVFRIKSI